MRIELMLILNNNNIMQMTLHGVFFPPGRLDLEDSGFCCRKKYQVLLTMIASFCDIRHSYMIASVLYLLECTKEAVGQRMLDQGKSIDDKIKLDPHTPPPTIQKYNNSDHHHHHLLVDDSFVEFTFLFLKRENDAEKSIDRSIQAFTRKSQTSTADTKELQVHLRSLG